MAARFWALKSAASREWNARFSDGRLWSEDRHANYYAPGCTARGIPLACRPGIPQTVLDLALTDAKLLDVVRGRESEPRFRRVVVWMVGSRLLGTLLAQALLVPSAYLIAVVARVL